MVKESEDNTRMNTLRTWRGADFGEIFTTGASNDKRLPAKNDRYTYTEFKAWYALSFDKILKLSNYEMMIILKRFIHLVVFKWSSVVNQISIDCVRFNSSCCLRNQLPDKNIVDIKSGFHTEKEKFIGMNQNIFNGIGKKNLKISIIYNERVHSNLKIIVLAVLFLAKLYGHESIHRWEPCS